MAQLRQDDTQFAAQDTEVIVVGPEGPGAFAALLAKTRPAFCWAAGPTASVLKLYGQEINLFKLGRMPAQVLIDKSGRVRFVHYGKSMSDIPQTEEMLELIRQMDTSGRVGAQA